MCDICSMNLARLNIICMYLKVLFSFFQNEAPTNNKVFRVLKLSNLETVRALKLSDLDNFGTLKAFNLAMGTNKY